MPANEQVAVTSNIETIPLELVPLPEEEITDVVVEPVSVVTEIAEVSENLPMPEWIIGDDIDKEPVYISTSSNQQESQAAKIMQYYRLFYVIFLLLLIIILSINIFVRFTIQHKSVLIQAILLIILIIALILFDFSFMKELNNAATNIILF